MSPSPAPVLYGDKQTSFYKCDITLPNTGVYMEHIRSSFTVICISTVMWFHTQLSYNLSRKIACARDFSWLGQYCDITAGC